MGKFTREGTFKNREAFLAGLKVKLEKLRDGVLRGATLEWKDGPAVLEGLGAKVDFTIGASAWSCAADLPPFIPIPQRMIEAKFDQEFGELKDL